MEHEDLEFQNRELNLSGFGDLPEDLRAFTPVSEDGQPYHYIDGALWEADNFAYTGGAARQYMEPIPEGFGPTPNITQIRLLPRYNYESFRSQQILASGSSILSPTGGSTFSSLATFTVPAGFAGVLTGVAQWVGDATAYNKPSGDPDDVVWKINIAGTGASFYSAFDVVLSDLTSPHRLFIIMSENNTIELAATSNIVSGSYGARDIPVKGYLIGYQFPIDEVDDIFRNR